MKLYPTAAWQYAQTSGRLKTPASVTSFMKVMRTLQRYYPEVEELDEFTPEDLADWCMSGDNPAPSTIRKRRAHVRSFFGWAKWKGLCEVNPAADLEYSVVPGRGYRRVHTWLSKEGAIEVIRACPKTDIGERDRLILLLGFLLGLRAADIVNLRWDQFTLDFSRLTVIGKGQKPAVIGVPTELVDALREWKTRRPYGAQAVIPRTRETLHPGKDRRVQVIDWDNPLKYDGVLYAVKRAGKRCDVALTPHDLRRSFAGILEESGVNLQDISRGMRHSNVGTTSVYLERNPNKAVAVTENLSLGL